MGYLSRLTENKFYLGLPTRRRTRSSAWFQIDRRATSYSVSSTNNQYYPRVRLTSTIQQLNLHRDSRHSSYNINSMKGPTVELTAANQSTSTSNSLSPSTRRIGSKICFSQFRAGLSRKSPPILTWSFLNPLMRASISQIASQRFNLASATRIGEFHVIVPKDPFEAERLNAI